jgi:hypothetical protein
MKKFTLSLVFVSACAIAANSALRDRVVDDATLVERSEMIVVGHLKDGSIQNVSHTNASDRSTEQTSSVEPRVPLTNSTGHVQPFVYHPSSNEGLDFDVPLSDFFPRSHPAVLVISEVIKGGCTNAEIPIVIGSGLDIRVFGPAGEAGGNDLKMDEHGAAANGSSEHAQIIERYERGSNVVVEDAGKDIVWFLRRQGGNSGRGLSATSDFGFGVVDAQDMQALKWKECFEAYLCKDPEEALKSYAANHPETSQRAQSWLDHLEIQRIVKIEDPAKRCESLLPHYLNDQTRGPELLQGIMSCGSIADGKLVPVFQDPKYKNRRLDIIWIWGAMDYKEAAPVLISLLEEGNRFWAEQNVTGGWQAAADRSEMGEKRQTVTSEVLFSVTALGKLRDPGSKATIEMTKQSWGSMTLGTARTESVAIGSVIVQECDRALKNLEATSKDDLPVRK